MTDQNPEPIGIDMNELKDLVTRLCELGEELGYQPYKFIVMLNVAAKYLADSQKIEIHSKPKVDA